MVTAYMEAIEQISDIWVNLGRQLVDAGWIRTFSREREGYSLEWSVKGARRAVMVRPIIEDFGVGVSPESAVAFTHECQKCRKRDHNDVREIGRLFWLSCLEELTLDHEGEKLWALAHLIRASSGNHAPYSVSVGLVILPLADIIHAHGRH